MNFFDNEFKSFERLYTILSIIDYNEFLLNNTFFVLTT